MMSKYTPGPWIAEPEVGRGAWVKGSNGEWSALACGDNDDSARANARLIAAAPDLLEALQLVIGSMPGERESPLAREVLRRVNRAISSAIGTPEPRS